eukprot:152134_1
MISRVKTCRRWNNTKTIFILLNSLIILYFFNVPNTDINLVQSSSDYKIIYQKKQNVDVALVFNGLMRSLNLVIGNLNENIFDVLKHNNITYHTYVHAYILNRTYSNPRNGIKNMWLNNDLYKLLNANFVLLDDQDTVQKQLNVTKYRNHDDPWHNHWFSLNGYILNMFSRYLITKELQSNVPKFKYKYVIFMRSDVIYSQPFDIAYFSMITNKNDVLIPNWGQWSGINNRFLLSSSDYGIKYGLKYEKMYEYSLDKQLHSETFEKDLLISYNANITEISLYFLIVRANGLVDYSVNCDGYTSHWRSNTTKFIPIQICDQLLEYMNISHPTPKFPSTI